MQKQHLWAVNLSEEWVMFTKIKKTFSSYTWFHVTTNSLSVSMFDSLFLRFSFLFYMIEGSGNINIMMINLWVMLFLCAFISNSDERKNLFSFIFSVENRLWSCCLLPTTLPRAHKFDFFSTFCLFRVTMNVYGIATKISHMRDAA